MSPTTSPSFLHSKLKEIEKVQKLMADPTSSLTPKPKILFLCTGNSCRSQMAEGFARHHLGEKLDVYSAGLLAQGINPLAVKAMDEVQIDISGHSSKTIDDLRGLARNHPQTPTQPWPCFLSTSPLLPLNRTLVWWLLCAAMRMRLVPGRSWELPGWFMSGLMTR